MNDILETKQASHQTPVTEDQSGSARMFEARQAKVWLGEDHICRVILNQGASIDIVDMQEFFALQSPIFGSQHFPVMIDLRGIQSSTRQAREFGASKVHEWQVIAVAIIESSPVSRILASLFINFNRPPYPARLFSDPTLAIEWLKSCYKLSKED